MTVGDDARKTLRPAKDVAAAKRLATRLRKGQDARRRKIGRVRSAVEHDDYENALKLSIAIDRLLDDLAK